MPTDSFLPSKAKWRSPDKPELQGTEYGLHTLVDKDPLTAGVTDIVAIHGLNGHYEKSWTEELSHYNWLRDTFSGSSGSSSRSMLARVMSFAYNSKVQYSKSTADILDFADQLLECLLAKRKSEMEQSRPIVFVCHSLGGIVFKQAFNVASGQSRYEGLSKMIIGVLFFGTPHKGSVIASFATSLGNLLRASSLGAHTNVQLLKDLDRHSSRLEQVSDTFLQLGGSLKIVTFYEVDKMDMMSSLVVEKSSAIMNMRNEVSIALNRNHRNLCKFSSRSDKMLELVMMRLAYVMDESTRSKELTNQDVLLRSLATSSPDLHKARNPLPVPGTCSWILNHDTYVRWLESSTPGLLWLSADPGCGKSVLAAFLVDHLRSEYVTPRKTNICYFFFKSDNEEQRDGVFALQALLHQLLQLQRELLDTASETLTLPKIGDVKALWSTIVTVLQQPLANETIFVLDGFDECETSSRKLLTSMLSTHFTPKKQPEDKRIKLKLIPTKLKVIISSRPENALKAAFDRPRSGLQGAMTSDAQKPQYSMIRLRGEDEIDAISHDINLVIDAEIEEIVEMGLPEELLQDVRRELVVRADRTFLWVTLIIQLLKEKAEAGASRRELQEILHNRDVDSIYAGLLSGRPHGAKSRKLLSLVLAATRPLSVEELSIALSVNPEFDTFESTSERRKPGSYSFLDIEDNMVYPFENHIKALCGHFVRIIRNKIYLVHETAREFLLEGQVEEQEEQDDAWFSFEDDDTTLRPCDTASVVTEPSLAWKGSFSLRQCHAICLEVCVTYIYCMGKVTQGVTRGQPSQRTAPFLDYAATAWIAHFAYIREELHTNHFPYYQNLCHPRFPGFTTWIQALALRTDKDVLTNPGGADDDVQDYYVSLFKMDTVSDVEPGATTQSVEEVKLRYVSSNPGMAENHHFPVTTNSNGWVSLNLDRNDFNDVLSNPWAS
ncbi:Fc.00g030270.m01.CDS01 [Cosmosporella sp. VM-42]